MNSHARPRSWLLRLSDWSPRRFAVAAVLLATPLASMFATARARGEDWPQWLGPLRNGVSSEAVEPWTEDPKVLWRQPMGSGFSVPVVAKGVVYVHSSAEGDAEKVTALDAATGQEKWTQSYPRAPYASALGAGPRATPTVAGDYLVTFGITGELACWRVDSGDVAWRINPYRDNQVSTPGFGACSSPLVEDNLVFIPVGGAEMAFAAYDIDTGKLAWKAFDEPAGTASPITWRRGSGERTSLDVVVQTTLRIIGLDPKDGSVRWQQPMVFQPAGVSPTPLVAQERLICTTQDTGTMSVESPNQDNKESKVAWWDQDLTSYFSTGTVGADGRLLLVTNVLAPLPRTDVHCIDPRSGAKLWKEEGVGYFHVGLIATGNDNLLILTDAGKLILAKATRDGYKELCQSTVCGGTFVNPVLSDGKLIVRDRGEILCLQLAATEE